MHLERHLEAVKAGVQNAAALADEHSQDIARRLGDALESSVRLAMIESLSEAATEISADLAPGSVEFRLAGGEPQFIVTAPPTEAPIPAAEPTTTDQEPEPAWTPSDGDEEQVRVTLRLPASVKAQVDERADADGVSTNTWLLQLVLKELGRRRGRGRPNGLDEFINDTVEGALRGWTEGVAWPPPGHPRGPQPPAPPVPPFPPDFPFNERRGANRRGTKQFRGWAQ